MAVGLCDTEMRNTVLGIVCLPRTLSCLPEIAEGIFDVACLRKFIFVMFGHFKNPLLVPESTSIPYLSSIIRPKFYNLMQAYNQPPVKLMLTPSA